MAHRLLFLPRDPNRRGPGEIVRADLGPDVVVGRLARLQVHVVKGEVGCAALRPLGVDEAVVADHVQLGDLGGATTRPRASAAR